MQGFGPALIAGVFCLSVLYAVRFPDTYLFVISAVSRILQPYELSIHIDSALLARLQVELMQNLTAPFFPKSEWTLFDLRPRNVLSDVKPRLLLMAATTDISVIVPTLNEEKYLPKCLTSLVNQVSEERSEIIVIDGGSTDRTIKIAEKYADKVVVAPKRPVGAARNIGAKKARGELLAFIDADTFVCPGWHDAVTQAFNGHSDIVGITGPTLPHDGTVSDWITYRLWTAYLQKLLLRLGMPHVIGFNCAYRRNQFLQVGGFDEHSAMSEDIRLAKKIRKQGKIAFEKRMLAFTSARRFKRYGRIYIGGLYLANGFATLLVNRSYSNYPPVR